MGNDFKILVVDDHKDICEFIELLLSEHGYSSVGVQRPSHALELLGDDESIRVAIIDIRLGRASGIELVEEIRKMNRDISVIMMTGHPTVETAVESMKHRVSDYIQKPFDNDEFMNTVNRILTERGLLVDIDRQLHLTIGTTIRQARKEKNLTLKQMSLRTGLSVSLLSQIERAESSASVSSLLKLSRALDCRIVDLFGEF